MMMSTFPVYELDRAVQIFKPLPINDKGILTSLAQKMSFWQKARR